MSTFGEKHIPRHVAIIMDGNGRWANAQGKLRAEGHIAGVQAVRNIVDDAARMGVKYLTIYAFSTENWLRPSEEVDKLMDLFAQSLACYGTELKAKGVRLLAIGDVEKLPESSLKQLNDTISLTSDNDTITLVVALSYSSRAEINHALCRCLEDMQENSVKRLGEKALTYPIEKYLETHALNIPDPDLLIRTGGEKRLSNFLLYQAAYAELYFTETLWPDFSGAHLAAAIEDFALRDRRFGKIEDKKHDTASHT